MGIFDFFKANNSKLRVNANECEDVGIVTHYKGKPLTGICFQLFENLKVEYEIEMIEGLKDGMFTEYYENGKIKIQTQYSKDKCIKVAGYFDDQGINHLEGKECICFNNLEEKDEILHFSEKPYNGLASGEMWGGASLKLYKEGVLISEKVFWNTGAFRADYDYQEGYSKEIRYQKDDGRLLREIKNGCKLTYHDKGYIEKEENIETGEVKEFYESGKIKTIKSYTKGKPRNSEYITTKSVFETEELESFSYDYDGMTICESYHKNGVVYKISTYQQRVDYFRYDPESIGEDITFYGNEEKFLSFISKSFGDSVNTNLIENGKLVKPEGHESNFAFGNITFKCEYEKVRRVIEDLIGGQIEEHENDEYEIIFTSPGQSEDIIESLFPGKYITVCRHVFLGNFEYNGNEESDIVQYLGDDDELNYVGGEYNEDINKPVSVEMFLELELEEKIQYEPKYESFEFIIEEKFTSLEDYVKKSLTKKK